jgi:hypothetical protein
MRCAPSTPRSDHTPELPSPTGTGTTNVQRPQEDSDDHAHRRRREQRTHRDPLRGVRDVNARRPDTGLALRWDSRCGASAGGREVDQILDQVPVKYAGPREWTDGIQIEIPIGHVRADSSQRHRDRRPRLTTRTVHKRMRARAQRTTLDDSHSGSNLDRPRYRASRDSANHQTKGCDHG